MKAPADSSPILPDVLTALAGGRPVLVTGLVRDDVLLEGEAYPLGEAIAVVWEQASEAIVLRWHPARGLQFEDDAHRPALEWVLERAAERRSEQATQITGLRGFAGALDSADPSDVAAVVSRLLLQRDARVCVILEEADLLPAEPGDPLARRIAAELSYALSRMPLGQLNAFVMLDAGRNRGSAAFGALPRLARLSLASPTVSIRRALLEAERRQFARGPRLSRAQRALALDRIATLSDGLSLGELATLPALSRVLGFGLADPEALVHAHHVGTPHDPWRSVENRLPQITQDLTANVIGQPAAVAQASEKLLIAASGLHLNPLTRGARPPRLLLFLVGPTGTGKTELARTLARSVFGDAEAMTRFDMADFQQAHALEQLSGAPPGYIGHEEGSRLVNALRERPFSVLLFDEIDKAHADAWTRLLALIDDGRITDGRGQTATLENAIVVMTANIGSAEFDQLIGRATARLTPQLVRRTFEDATDRYLRTSAGLGRPEVAGRLMGSLIAFDMLREDAVAGIVRKFLDALCESARRARGIDLHIDEEAIGELVSRELGDPGTWHGRRVKTILADTVLLPLAQQLIHGTHDPACPVVISRSGQRLEVHVKQERERTRRKIVTPRRPMPVSST